MAVWAMLPHSNKMMMMMMIMMMMMMMTTTMTMMIMIKLLPCILYEKKYVHILALEMASARNQHCANCIGTLFVPYVSYNCSSSGKLYSVFEHLDVL